MTGFPRWASILSTILGSLAISLGMVLQKKGVSWLRWSSSKDAKYRRFRSVWLWGFALNNMLSIFYFFALKGLSPSIVGAMMGLNIAFMAGLSALILGEPISRRVATGSLAMIGFIVLANLSSSPHAPTGQPSFMPVAAFFIAPYILAGMAFVLKRLGRLRKEVYGLIFAGAAGALEGVIIVLIKTMQTVYGDAVLNYVFTPYLYMYIAAGFSAIAFMQIAYTHARLTSSGPVLWAVQITYPVLIGYALFAMPFVPIQFAAFMGILLCSVLMHAGH